MQALTRRSLITGLISLAATPAIVRAENLMPVKPVFVGVDLAAGDLAEGTVYYFEPRSFFVAGGLTLNLGPLSSWPIVVEDSR